MGHGRTFTVSIAVDKSDVSIRIHRAVNHCGSQRALAMKLEISEQYLSDMIRGTREWSDGLLEHVGVERYTGYEDLGKPKWMK